ncbi:MAG: phage terminase small subunit P27 family [Alphaproteobacteria bacterium]
MKDLQGNPGKRRSKAQVAADAERAAQAAQVEAALAPETEDLKGAPPYLSAEAKKVWKRIAVYVAAMRFVRSIDGELVARYAEHLATWWDLTTKLRRQGITYETKSAHGKLKRIHPLLLARDRVEAHLIDAEDRLGLNPRSRQDIMLKQANTGLRHPGEGLFGNDDAAPAKSDETPNGGSQPQASAPPIGFLNRPQTRH